MIAKDLTPYTFRSLLPVLNQRRFLQSISGLPKMSANWEVDPETRSKVSPPAALLLVDRLCMGFTCANSPDLSTDTFVLAAYSSTRFQRKKAVEMTDAATVAHPHHNGYAFGGLLFD